jgi:hypothetical protein
MDNNNLKLNLFLKFLKSKNLKMLEFLEENSLTLTIISKTIKTWIINKKKLLLNKTTLLILIKALIWPLKLKRLVWEMTFKIIIKTIIQALVNQWIWWWILITWQILI